MISTFSILKAKVVLSAFADIKALETLGYAEHICNYVVILDSWFYGKIYVQLIGHKRAEYVMVLRNFRGTEKTTIFSVLPSSNISL